MEYFLIFEKPINLRFAQLRGSGNAKRLCAKATVAPMANNKNVRSIDMMLAGFIIKKSLHF